MSLLTRPIMVLMIPIVLVSIISAITLISNNSPIDIQDRINQGPVLEPDQDIIFESQVNQNIYVGEPFEYKIRVVYRPDVIKPDFRKLLRDVNFAPFEQLHRSRTSIIETVISPNEHEFQLSYSIVGISVIPGELYLLDPLTIEYIDLEANSNLKLESAPWAVTIDKYYTDEAINIPFQSLKSVMADYTSLRRLIIILFLIIFIVTGGVLIWLSVRKRLKKGHSVADLLKQQIEELKRLSDDKRIKLIHYEKIILSLINHYDKYSAWAFWTTRSESEPLNWRGRSHQLKKLLQTAYSEFGPEDRDIGNIENQFEKIYAEIESECIEERAASLSRLEGPVMQRISRNRVKFGCGIATFFVAVLLLLLLINQHLWVNQDVQIYNNWINSLPGRFFDQSRAHELGNLDVEMLGHISDQQRVLENLESDYLRSAYLYDYGTIVAKVYKTILTMPPQDEEEEAAEPPSFEFPLQLIANATRFYPFDEDVRRNFEIIIMLKESQEDKGSDEIEGELGPPTPGFSRDMNQILF